MQFSEIAGHREEKAHLIRTVRENRVSHAQLFLGPEGSGSLALAFAYAQYICCLKPSEEDSCGECSSCRKYKKLIHPDLHFSYPFFAQRKEDTALTYIQEWRSAFLNNPYLSLDEWRGHVLADNKQANINIEECHQIIQKLSLKPFEAEYKVLILWLPEYLSKEGNTLLKIIEEPPQKTLFLLVAQNQDQILNTILSRTQLVKIKKFDDKDVEQYLVNSKGIDVNIARKIAYLSEGNMQKALAIAREDVSNEFAMMTDWLRICFLNSGLKVAGFVEMAAKLGRENQKNFLIYGTRLMREVLMHLSGAESLINIPDNEKEFVARFSQTVTEQKINLIVKELEKAHYHIERNANPKILFLDVSLQLIRIFNFNTLPEGTHYIY